jgi:hypothetical protein
MWHWCLLGLLLQVQPPTKKVMAPQAFFNGLKGKVLMVHQHEQQEAPAMLTAAQ